MSTEKFSGHPAPSSEVIDRVSLEQALLDTEIALARAHDLMLRLVELREQLADERTQNLQLKKELEETRSLYDAILANRAYRTAAKAWAFRRALGV